MNIKSVPTPVDGQWTTGLFECFSDDPSNCFMTCCCPCITFGQIAEIVDKGVIGCTSAAVIYQALAFAGCGWLYACTYRTKLRALFGLPETPCSDCLVHGCCCLFALCQEYRELKNRGLDPSIGWEANAEKLGRDKLAPVFVAQNMTR